MATPRRRPFGQAYSQINMNTMPGEIRMPGSGKGADVAKQAEALDYQDIPRDIQAMRVAEYNKEVKEGEFVPEFSGYRRGRFAGYRRGTLSGYLGDAAKKTAPGLMLAGALLALYLLFGRKDQVAEEIVLEPVSNPEEDDVEEVDELDFID